MEPTVAVVTALRTVAVAVTVEQHAASVGITTVSVPSVVSAAAVEAVEVVVGASRLSP